MGDDVLVGSTSQKDMTLTPVVVGAAIVEEQMF